VRDPVGTTRFSFFFANFFLPFFSPAATGFAMSPLTLHLHKHELCLGAAFFLFATVPRRGLAVRALVCVRWPRVGRLRRCRSPRYDPISISRLMFIATSLRRFAFHRAFFFNDLADLGHFLFAQVLDLLSGLMPARPRMESERVRPIP